jgi:hypothetical protein
MEGGDADLTAPGSNVLSSQHSSVGRGLVTVSLDLHATCGKSRSEAIPKTHRTRLCTSDTGDGLLAGEISDMDEGVVEGGVDVGNTKDKLALADLGAERDSGFLDGSSGLLGSLTIHPLVRHCIQHRARSPLLLHAIQRHLDTLRFALTISNDL